MKRRTQTSLPATLPSWIEWDAWEAVRPRPATDEPPTARPKRNREPAVWRETTDLERRAIAAYRTCYTPPWSFDRRLCRKIRDDKITEGIARWLWFYVHKHRKQIADVEVVREAARRKETDR
jgi:hypothetical protein